MARYTGPKSRIARKFGEGIFGADKVLSKKNYPPGQHGNNRRRKTSEYGVMLAEKNKKLNTYGVKNNSVTCLKRPASVNRTTGEILLKKFRLRLDKRGRSVWVLLRILAPLPRQLAKVTSTLQ